MQVKIKLSVSDDCFEEISRLLTEHGIEIDDDAELILIQRDRYPDHLAVRDRRGDKAVIATDDIVTIESYGHTIELHTLSGVFTASQQLYRFEEMLDPKKFIRISNSVIISRAQIQSISPTFSMKFTLKMKNGDKVDVTRSYYGRFKEFLGI